MDKYSTDNEKVKSKAMSEWKTVRLGDVCEQIRGVSYKPDDLHNDLNDNSVALLRANNIFEDALNYDELVYVDNKKVSESQYLKKGDILICASSGSKNLVGKAACLEEDRKLTFGAFCKVLRTDSVNHGFFKHYFFSPSYRTTISNLSAGANINNIRAEDLDNLQIPLPPLEEQKLIAAQLDKCTALIAKNRQMLEKYDTLIKSRFIEMLAVWKKNYDYKPLEYYIDSITYGFTNPMPDANEGPWKITAKDIVNGCINYSTARRTNRLDYDKLTSKSKPDKNDVLVTKDGTLGRVALVDNSDICINQSVAAIKCTIKILPQFLSIMLQSPEYQNLMKKDAGGGTIKHIYITKLAKMNVLVPSIEEQQKIVNFKYQIDKSKFAVQKSLEKAEILYKSLMQEYFG